MGWDLQRDDTLDVRAGSGSAGMMSSEKSKKGSALMEKHIF